jgi:hypothetical protein
MRNVKSVLILGIFPVFLMGASPASCLKGEVEQAVESAAEELAHSGPRVPYLPDANTVLLDHFNGSTLGTLLGHDWDRSSCGTAFSSVAPGASFTDGQPGLGEALQMSRPSSYPGGSVTYVRYSGEAVSIPQGTLEMWVYVTGYEPQENPGWGMVTQRPSNNSCAGITFTMGLDSAGHLGASSWGWSCSFGLRSTGEDRVPLGQWTHVAVSWGAGGAKLYLGGELVATDPCADGPAAGFGGHLMILNESDRGTGSLVDELRVSDVQRTSFNL